MTDAASMGSQEQQLGALIAIAMLSLLVFVILLVGIFTRDETINDFLNFSARLRATAIAKK